MERSSRSEQNSMPAWGCATKLKINGGIDVRFCLCYIVSRAAGYLILIKDSLNLDFLLELGG